MNGPRRCGTWTLGDVPQPLQRINATCSTSNGCRDYLREKSQTEKAKYPGASLISVINKKNLSNEHSEKTLRLTDLQNAPVPAAGEYLVEGKTMEQGTDSPHGYI